ncbi:MAG: helix-turn-helix domain-containing protein [Clostridia bacterium]|nr:helix-turn-helix domain-containing protein [Clostridia bacterium]
MSRYKPLLEHSSTDRIELKRIVQNPLSDPDIVLRARAILSFLDGLKGDVIAKELNVRPNTVSDWRKRYVENGVEGLYTRAPKGKRGSETRDKVLETLDTQPPEGGWNTKALAESVGTSVDTVRRALKDEHLTTSKSYIWNREIQRNPATAYVDVVGLYMAKDEAGLIIRVDSQMRAPSSGFVTTHNRELVQRLEQTDNDLSLMDAISASIQEMKEVYRGNREVFQDFAGRIFKDENSRAVCKTNTASGKCYHYIYYWHESSKAVNPILQESSVIVRVTEDIDVWFGMIEPWITLSQNITGKDAGSLVSLICFYMKKTTVFVEPFEWRRTTARRGFVG